MRWWWYSKAQSEYVLEKERAKIGHKHWAEKIAYLELTTQRFSVDYVENNKYNIDWEFLRHHNRHVTTAQTPQYKVA